MRGPTGAAEEKSVVSGETEEKQIAGGVERGREEGASHAHESQCQRLTDDQGKARAGANDIPHRRDGAPRSSLMRVVPPVRAG